MQKEKNKVSSRFKNMRISNGFTFEMGRKKVRIRSEAVENLRILLFSFNSSKFQ